MLSSHPELSAALRLSALNLLLLFFSLIVKKVFSCSFLLLHDLTDCGQAPYKVSFVKMCRRLCYFTDGVSVCVYVRTHVGSAVVFCVRMEQPVLFPPALWKWFHIKGKQCDICQLLPVLEKPQKSICLLSASIPLQWWSRYLWVKMSSQRPSSPPFVFCFLLYAM